MGEDKGRANSTKQTAASHSMLAQERDPIVLRVGRWGRCSRPVLRGLIDVTFKVLHNQQ